jgi:hypothetical protein
LKRRVSRGNQGIGVESQQRERGEEESQLREYVKRRVS